MLSRAGLSEGPSPRPWQRAEISPWVKLKPSAAGIQTPAQAPPSNALGWETGEPGSDSVDMNGITDGPSSLCASARAGAAVLDVPCGARVPAEPRHGVSEQGSSRGLWSITARLSVPSGLGSRYSFIFRFAG